MSFNCLPKARDWICSTIQQYRLCTWRWLSNNRFNLITIIPLFEVIACDKHWYTQKDVTITLAIFHMVLIATRFFATIVLIWRCSILCDFRKWWLENSPSKSSIKFAINCETRFIFHFEIFSFNIILITEVILSCFEWLSWKYISLIYLYSAELGKIHSVLPLYQHILDRKQENKHFSLKFREVVLILDL